MRLVADGERQPAGQVGVGVGRAGGRGRAEHPEAGRPQLAQLDVVDDRQQEQRAGRRPHDLRVGRVDGVRREHDRVGPGRLGRPQDGAEVARIGQADGDDDEAGAGQDLGRRGAVADDGQQGLRRLRGRHPLQHAGRQRRAGHTGEHPARRRRALRARRSPRARDPPARRPRRAGRALDDAARPPPGAHCGAPGGAAVAGPSGWCRRVRSGRGLQAALGGRRRAR